MRQALAALLLCALLPAWPAPRAEANTDLSPHEERRLQRGEVIVHVEQTGDRIKRTLVTGLIDAPPAAVYPIYTDFESYPELFKSARSSEILKRDGNVLTCKVVMDFPWPLGSRWVSNYTYLDPANTSFTFKKFEGSVKIYEGALVIMPEGKARSRVIYTAKVDPDLPVPAWLVSRIQVHYFPMAILRVREKVAKLPSPKPTE
jgi:ribosome-associated toxin RatA of RatAB toxin-antitoxin module